MIGLGFEIPPLVNTSCITPDFWCTVEHWMSLACLYVGAGFYALLISNVSFIVQNISRGKINLREMVISVNEYMRAKHIPAPIREKVRSFFKIKFGATGGKLYDEAEILSELTPNLREEIIYYNQRELFQLVPLFKRGPSSFSHKLAPRLKGRVHFAAEFIFEEESHGDEIFFISSGICEIISCYSETVFKLIADGYYFGDVGCLMQCPRTAGVRAKVSTTLYSLSREDLDCVLDDHPHMHKYMILIAQRRRLRLAFLNPENGMTTLNAESMRDDEDSRTEYFAKVQSMQAQEALVENEATRIGKQRSTLVGLRETFKNGISAKKFSGIAGSDGVKENGEATDAEPAEPASPTFGRMGNLGNLWTRSRSSRGAGLNLKNSLSPTNRTNRTNGTNGTNAGSQVRPVFDGRNNGQRNDPKGLRKGLVKAQSQRPTRNPDAASTLSRRESFRKRSASDGL
uniref:Cyclic nucleotide-binding domain-containing protein n=1 Tax=Florenciella parvula TaxID=236787 RepID=A0A7S2CR32_9STRA|mmetsp:Transcript_4311/g.8942  ORF Transcript_4311/g.8942 Transcript_4311/m.8942 type:complete len:457 (+) Transcript_4311:3-1373(+)